MNCNCESGSAYRSDLLNYLFHAICGGLGVLAASHCTMNNFTLGNAKQHNRTQRNQYCETISVRSGAGPGFNGTNVVQTHTTNSRLTEPEVLEFRFPMRLDSYEICSGAGQDSVAVSTRSSANR